MISKGVGLDWTGFDTLLYIFTSIPPKLLRYGPEEACPMPMSIYEKGSGLHS